MIATSQKYLDDAIRFGAKIGDRVTVIKKYPSRTGGWENGWSDNMDRYIGQSGILTKICEEGHYIDFGNNDIRKFGFPWFSLKIIR